MRKLRRLGCELDRKAKGDHEIWINLSSHARTTISLHCCLFTAQRPTSPPLRPWLTRPAPDGLVHHRQHASRAVAPHQTALHGSPALE
ncbi:MAG: type II toxin-antitoxin system HicA family toxin [Chloroflexi bacterium]|nr:type II toxin-antitoxin system HicA family toxin [Chloroflexota bacterium]